MSDKNQYTIKDLIQKMLKSYQIEGRVQEVDLRQNWEQLMGTMINKHTRSLYINNQKLFLAVDSSVLRQELSYGKTLIIEKVNDFFGEVVIKDVVLK
jgi:predicted nucleic acid-binding Zn ribbon protein